jgi:hypothetical protein
MTQNSAGCQEKSFFGDHSYMVIETLKSQKDSSNPEKEFST